MKILLCNESYPKAVEQLNQALPEHTCVSCAVTDVAQNLDGVDVIVPSIAKITAEIIQQGNFGLIQQLGIGLDTVDIPAATERGVWVARVPGAGSGNAESVAELAVLFILASARRFDEARRNVAEGVFFKPIGRSLLGKTVCIVGLGDIGVALAERLQPFGVKLKGVRKRPEIGAPEQLRFLGVYGMEDLASAFADSDFVVMAIPETDETRNFINQKSIALMKKGCFLVNVGRGGLVDHDALLEGLRAGQIAGAGLDVFKDEPANPDDPLFKENVLATPHIGGNTDASVAGIIRVIAENVRLFAAGQTPQHVVNAPVNLRRHGSVVVN
ncbi:MAG: 2-hydroxyacid dehydrogenase [Candidatus Obscuribacterales bacterium]|nr:2-hydroxyacid dehydrogenase [Candidatus Obscuribacterales bacterium]